MIRKETRRIRNYKDLTIEIQCMWMMWNVKTKVIPVTTGATATISITQYCFHVTAYVEPSINEQAVGCHYTHRNIAIAGIVEQSLLCIFNFTAAHFEVF